MLKLQRPFSIFGLAALVLGVSAGAEAAPLVVFNFTDLNATADIVAANVTSSPFAEGGGLLNESFASGAANARGWNPSDGAAEALANGDFWTFTVSAQAGYVFDVDSIALDEWRESAGPMEFQLFAGGALIGSALSTNSLVHEPRHRRAQHRCDQLVGPHPGVGRLEQWHQRRFVSWTT